MGSFRPRLRALGCRRLGLPVRLVRLGAERGRLLAALAAVLLALLQPPATASAESIFYTIQPGSTLQLGAGPVDVLTGFLSIDLIDHPSFGEVELEVTSLGIASNSFSASASGPFPFVRNENQVGFGLGRTLTLQDVGLLEFGDPPKGAAFHYGFDAELVLSTEAFDRYRAWTLASSPGSSWRGIFAPPDSLALQLGLTEHFFDLGRLGIVGISTGQSGQLMLNAVQVPEPGVASLVAVGLVLLGAWRITRRMPSPR